MANNTIKLKSYIDVQEEYTAGGAITPGHAVYINSSNAVVVTDADAKVCIPMFAVEDEHQGKTINQAYASGDKVQVWIPNRGDIVNAILAKSEKVVIGDMIEIADDGEVRKWRTQTTTVARTSAGAIVGMALQALDLTATHAVPTRIAVRVR